MLLKDGRLGLIDYGTIHSYAMDNYDNRKRLFYTLYFILLHYAGQVKTIDLETRINYAKLILAHAKNDKKEVVRLHFDVFGTKTKRQDPEIGYVMSAFYNDRNTKDITQGMNIATFIDYMEASDPMINVPDNIIMASRMSLMLRGMGNAFGLQLKMSQMWKDEAEALLKSQKIDY